MLLANTWPTLKSIAALGRPRQMVKKGESRNLSLTLKPRPSTDVARQLLGMQICKAGTTSTSIHGVMCGGE